jgi:hypothetical protein
VYEDLGINSGTALDPSFNVNNFPCATMAENDPMRALSFEFALSGTINHFQDARRQTSPGHQTPYDLSGLTTSPALYAPAMTATSTEQLLGVYEPISELACSSTGCFGESGEAGFSVQTAGCSKERYWLDESNADMAPLTSGNKQPVFECPTVDLRSFDEQQCTEPVVNDFQFPAWDELLVDLQNPTSDSGFDLTIPISATGVSMGAVEGTMSMPWDDTEMNFDMDMDLDLDLELN